jgi:methanogenic corrinoid protein MtbC1
MTEPTTMIPTTAVDEFLGLAWAGRRQAAVRLVLGLLDEGTPAASIVTDLLGAAQHEVGARWFHGEWSAADEHLVTSVAQAALEALITTTPYRDTEGLVVVACAESDWHSLPAQMFAELLRSHGQGTLYLGASTPAEDVASYLERRQPDALTITCNLSLSYFGTARLVDAAHRHGVPVLAGGRALTADRAAALGADAWAPDVRAAAEVLRTWRATPPSVDPAPVRLDPGAVELEARATALADQAFGDLERRFPPMVDYDARQLRRTHEDLVYIVRYLAVTRLVDDPAVFRTFRGWLTELLAHRGVPAAALDAGLASLAPLVREVDERAYRLAVDEAS